MGIGAQDKRVAIHPDERTYHEAKTSDKEVAEAKAKAKQATSNAALNRESCIRGGVRVPERFRDDTDINRGKREDFLNPRLPLMTMVTSLLDRGLNELGDTPSGGRFLGGSFMRHGDEDDDLANATNFPEEKCMGAPKKSEKLEVAILLLWPEPARNQHAVKFIFSAAATALATAAAVEVDVPVDLV